MLLDIEYSEGKQYTEEEALFIYNVWEQLYDSYYQQKNDSKGKLVLEKSYEIMLLGKHISDLEMFVRSLKAVEDVKDVLPEADYARHKIDYLNLAVKQDNELKVKLFEDIPTNIKIIEKRLAGLQNKHKRMEADNYREVQEQVDNVFTVVARVSKICEMRLNAKEMVVSEWLAYEKMAKDLVKASEEDLRKRKKH